MKVYSVHSVNSGNWVKDLFKGLVELGLLNYSLTGEGDSENEITLKKCSAPSILSIGCGTNKTRKEGSIISQLIGEHQRLQNRMAIKGIIRYTHFIAHQHIGHTNNFKILFKFVVSCRGETFQAFLDSAGGNAMYTSSMLVLEFVNAIGTWMEESLLKQLHMAPFLALWPMNVLMLLTYRS